MSFVSPDDASSRVVCLQRTTITVDHSTLPLPGLSPVAGRTGKACFDGGSLSSDGRNGADPRAQSARTLRRGAVEGGTLLSACGRTLRSRRNQRGCNALIAKLHRRRPRILCHHAAAQQSQQDIGKVATPSEAAETRKHRAATTLSIGSQSVQLARDFHFPWIRQPSGQHQTLPQRAPARAKRARRG